MEIINRGTTPTFTNKIRAEVLDITLASREITNRVKIWHVSDEETLSDHKEINFSVTCDAKQSNLFRNPRNTDWLMFNKTLLSKLGNCSKLRDINSTGKLDEAVDFLTKSINSAFIRACPGRKN